MINPTAPLTADTLINEAIWEYENACAARYEQAVKRFKETLRTCLGSDLGVTGDYLIVTFQGREYCIRDADSITGNPRLALTNVDRERLTNTAGTAIANTFSDLLGLGTLLSRIVED